MRIRERTEDDLDALGALVEITHEADGYPPHWPANTEASAFFASRHELAAWVAEDDEGTVVGHVAVHDAGPGRPVTDFAAEATGLPPAQLAAVARLVVHPRARRQSIARQLLTIATAHAHALGRQPILDTTFAAATALYESSGWRRIGSATIVFGSPCGPRCVHDPGVLASLVYLGPEP